MYSSASSGETRDALSKIERVVFLSGDVHCSMTSELTHVGDDSFKVGSVISSSFFWPYPQGQASNFTRQGPLTGNYVVSRTGKVISTDNFTRITASEDRVSVSYYARKGDLLGEDEIVF